MMAGQLSWLERMIHNHEVPGSIPGPATDEDLDCQEASTLGGLFYFEFMGTRREHKKITFKPHFIC